MVNLGLTTSLATIGRPADGIQHINGLEILSAWSCLSSGCRFISISRKKILQHLRIAHQAISLPKGRRIVVDPRGEQGFSKVFIQSLLSSKAGLDYFIVNPDQASLSRPLQLPILSETSLVISSLRDFIEKREEQTVIPPDLIHISEDTPWLKRTRFAAYIRGLNTSLFREVLALSKPSEDLVLDQIYFSFDRTFEEAYSFIKEDTPLEQSLSFFIRTTINTFRQDMRSPDPIRPLQNQSTLITYRDCWKSLLSFYYRLSPADNPFNRQLFTVEIAQRRAWQSVLLRAKILANNLEDSAKESSSSTNFSYTSLKSSRSDS